MLVQIGCERHSEKFRKEEHRPRQDAKQGKKLQDPKPCLNQRPSAEKPGVGRQRKNIVFVPPVVGAFRSLFGCDRGVHHASATFEVLPEGEVGVGSPSAVQSSATPERCSMGTRSRNAPLASGRATRLEIINVTTVKAAP